MKRYQLFIFIFILQSMACSLFERKNESPVRVVRDQSQKEMVNENKSGLKYRLVFLPFIDLSPAKTMNVSAGLTHKSRSRLMKDLNRTGAVMALASDDFKIQNMAINPKTNDYDLPKVAAELINSGVSGLVEGQIVDFRVQRKTGQVGLVRNLRSSFECVVRIRVANIRGGKEIFNTVKTVTLEQDDIRVAERIASDQFISTHPELTEAMIQEAFLEFTPQIIKSMEKLQWEGRIAAIQADRIFLNVGRVSGLKVGDLLKVSEEGPDIFDPETGVKIGTGPGRLKGTLELISFFGQDGAVTVIHSGAGFKENDRVELY